MIKTLPLILYLLFSTSSAVTTNAPRQWQNPAEKYANEYKKHLKARCPLPRNHIKHFVYFARDREALQDHPLLHHPRLAGAQIMYTWKQLEPQAGRYDFSVIQADIDYLAKYEKKLFVQLQDATFNPRFAAVPDDLKTSYYNGGVVPQRNDRGVPTGWVAKRWNPQVQKRFAALLKAMGKTLDGQIEGINLQESAIGVDQDHASGFTPEKYRDAVQQNMLALKKAFPTAVTLQYANFMPGEWRPWEDKGFLSSIYAFGNQRGIGLGAPDLMIRSKGQLNHGFALMHEHVYQVPLGVAIQDGNYVGKTDTLEVKTQRQNLVPALHSFAHQFLKVDYLFWGNQAPYFQEDLLSCL